MLGQFEADRYPLRDGPRRLGFVQRSIRLSVSPVADYRRGRASGLLVRSLSVQPHRRARIVLQKSLRETVAVSAILLIAAFPLAACKIPFASDDNSCEDFLNASPSEQASIAAKTFPNAGPMRDPMTEVGFYCSVDPSRSINDISAS